MSARCFGGGPFRIYAPNLVGRSWVVRLALRRCADVVMLGAMREREFWQLLEEVFGRSYGRALAHDQGLTQLHGMTVVEALAAGEEPRVVWNVLCDQMDVPDAKRWGRDHNAPPLPVDFR